MSQTTVDSAEAAFVSMLMDRLQALELTVASLQTQIESNEAHIRQCPYMTLEKLHLLSGEAYSTFSDGTRLEWLLGSTPKIQSFRRSIGIFQDSRPIENPYEEAIMLSGYLYINQNPAWVDEWGQSSIQVGGEGITTFGEFYRELNKWINGGHEYGRAVTTLQGKKYIGLEWEASTSAFCTIKTSSFNFSLLDVLQ